MKDLTAMILAGGKGSRLSPWPAPKCLMPILGIPILYRIIDHVAPHVDLMVVCVGYRAGDVRAATPKTAPNLLVSDAGEGATMCERLLRAREEYEIAGRILVLYGDELADVDIPRLLAQHGSDKTAMTMTGCKYRLPFGVVESDGFIQDECDVLVNIGFAVIEPIVWGVIAGCKGLSEMFNRVAWTDHETHIYEHRGRRATINSPADIAAAEEVWK